MFSFAIYLIEMTKQGTCARPSSYVPTAVTVTLSLPSTTSAGKVNIISLETFQYGGESSNSTAV